MSRQNVEVVRRVFEALEREDWVSIAESISEDCEIHDFDIPDAHVYRGPDGFMDWLAAWDKAWERWSMRDLDFRAVGRDRVLVQFEMVATGASSGVRMQRKDAIAYTIQGNEISRIEYYNDQQQALEAVGLRG